MFRIFKLPFFNLPDDPLERALVRETLESERERMLLLLGVLVVALVIYTTLGFVFAEVVFAAGRVIWIPLLAFVGAFVYTLGVRTLFGYLIRTGRQVPTVGRYANILTETSLPTIIILALTQFIGPADALLSPPAYIYFFFILLSIWRLNFAMSLFTGAVAAAEYMGVAWFFRHEIATSAGGLINRSLVVYGARALILLLLGLAAGFVAFRLKTRLRAYMHAQEERGALLNLFGQHLSPEVVTELLHHDQTADGQTHFVCLMFLDIRNFSTYAENRDPIEVVGYLNQLFDFMAGTVNRHHGIVNKFLGDGFMAIFGAPLPDTHACYNAVAAALEIQQELATRQGSGTLPPTRIGIGLHAGEAVTGVVGGESRKEYTVIGDVVNVAARIEQLNKQLGTQILVSEAVWTALGSAAPTGVALAPIEVKGRATPVQIYQLA